MRDARLEPPDTLLRRAGPALAAVLQRALRPHPAERFACAADMARALLAVESEDSAEQPWHVATRVAETLAAERPASASMGRQAAERSPSPFSAALREAQGDEDP